MFERFLGLIATSLLFSVGIASAQTRLRQPNQTPLRPQAPATADLKESTPIQNPDAIQDAQIPQQCVRIVQSSSSPITINPKSFRPAKLRTPHRNSKTSPKRGKFVGLISIEIH